MKNPKELQIIFGSATDASAQLKRMKEDKCTVNGTSILMTSVNQNVTGAKSLASARSTKFFNQNSKINNLYIKEKDYETH